MKSKDILLISLAAILLSACGSSGPSNVPAPPSEVNYTFSVSVTRLGVQQPNIGWYSSGEVFLTVDPDGEVNVYGSGGGTAGFDASTQICTDMGGWPVEFTATGSFNKSTCELIIVIEETWPQTKALSNCLFGGGSFTGGEYSLTFPNLKFSQLDPREDTSTSEGVLTWINTFKLYYNQGLEETECFYAPPEP
ncbi:MAG: hypothetical protein ABFS17_14540 [Chloroflexota bacterium]